MDNETIKEALSYSLGSDMHEVWRNSRKREDATLEELARMKKEKEGPVMGLKMNNKKDN